MVAALGLDEPVGGVARRSHCLRADLEVALGVEAGDVSHASEPERIEDRPRRVKAAVEECGADHGLYCVGESLRVFRQRRRALVAPEARGEFVACGRFAESGRGDHVGALYGEHALRRVGQGAVEPLRRDEAENGVAEEFEPLVVGRIRTAHLERRRRQRFFEKRGVFEGVPEYFHDGHLCVLSASA